MSPARATRSRLYLLTVLCISLAVFAHALIQQNFGRQKSRFSQMLYLPSGTYLKAASFGYHALVADLIYLWSIQYYGDPAFRPQLQYLEHTYNIITELDPQYLDVYQTGALFMEYEGRNPEAALRLLDKGLRKNPSEWLLPTSAGFYCLLSLKDRKRSLEYFEKAANISGSPSLVQRMRAGLYFRLGEKKVAYNLWSDIYNTAERATVKQTAYQHMHDLKVLIDLEEIRDSISRFRQKQNQNPLNLNQLVSAGYAQAIPVDPEGRSYQYDPQNGAVTYSDQLTVYKRYQ